MSRWLHTVVGTALAPRQRTERGLSQSTENAILLAAALGIATLITAVVWAFVRDKMSVFT